MLIDVNISSTFSAIDFPDIKFMSIHRMEEFLSMIPCSFYAGEVKELAVATYKNKAIDIIVPTSVPKPDIREQIKDMLRKELKEGDRVTFNFVTGDILIRNGNMQVKYFTPVPVFKKPPTNAPYTSVQYGLCFTLNDKDVLGYIYTSDEEDLNELFVLSILCRKEFILSDRVEPTSFGYALCAKIIEKMQGIPKISYPKEMQSYLCPQITDTTTLNESIFCELQELKLEETKVNEEEEEEDEGILIPDTQTYINKLITDGKGRAIISVPVKNPVYNVNLTRGSYSSFLPEKVSLCEVLSHQAHPTKYPTELSIDMAISSLIKRVNIVSPNELEVCVANKSAAENYPSLLEPFEGFHTFIKEL